MIMQHIEIQVNKLDHSPENARRTDAGNAAADLKASILAHGLMQNLVVTAAGDRFRVIAGGRRLEALRSLQQEGKLPPDFAVPCQVVDDGNALELSLVENTVRQAMHPADEFVAFARLIEGGESAAAIADRFGVSERHVNQRLKLGNVAPQLLTEYRESNLTLDCLMAFAISDNHERQLSVYESLQPWQAADPHHIRACLTEAMLDADSKLARFVGLEAYHAAGGISRADLFGDEVYLENPELLHRLAGEKLDSVRRELEAEGWKWVEVRLDRQWGFASRHRHLPPQPVDAPQVLLDRKEELEAQLEEIEQALEDTESDELIEAQEEAEARLAELEEQIESFVAYDREQRTMAGCYVTIGHDGELSIEKGLVRPQDLKRQAEAEDSAAPEPKPRGLPQTLTRDLESCRLEAAQVEIARHRLIALDLLAFTIARVAVAKRPVVSGPDLQLTRHAAGRKEATQAGEALAAMAESLPLAWLHQETEAAQFQAFLALSDKERLDFLAYGVALSLKPQLSTGNEHTAYELALSLTDADLAASWRPTRASYLGRITRDQLLTLGRSLFGEPWSQAHSRDKKGELADHLERAFAEPEKYAGNPEQLEQLNHWLPEGMAFGAVLPETTEAQTQAAA